MFDSPRLPSVLPLFLSTRIPLVIIHNEYVFTIPAFEVDPAEYVASAQRKNQERLTAAPRFEIPDSLQLHLLSAMQKPLTVCNLCSGITWMTKEGLKKPNYWGSVTQASTCRIGNFRGEEAYTPFSSLLPMVHPNDIVWGGWDISSLNLAEAMERAQVRQTSCHNACA